MTLTRRQFLGSFIVVGLTLTIGAKPDPLSFCERNPDHWKCQPSPSPSPSPSTSPSPSAGQYGSYRSGYPGRLV